MGLTGEQRALLDSTSFSFRSLENNAGFSIWRVLFDAAIWPAIVFDVVVLCLCAGRSFWNYAFATIFIVLALFGLTVMFIALLLGIVFAMARMKVRAPAVLFWMWWPTWTCALSWLAVILGVTVADIFWYDLFGPYTEIGALQKYGNVNPATMPGERFQDAGIVNFANGVTIDRSRGGCFVNVRTYCVAPILEGGTTLKNFANAPSSGGYDYFAVGVDCCDCPNQDFRCGDWNNPLTQGGLRSIDAKSRPFFRLAVDDWAAAYSKTPKHPLFFDWVDRPEAHWQMLNARGIYFLVLACCGAFPVFCCIALVVDAIFRALVSSDIAKPIDTIEPPWLMQGLWRYFLPLMHKRNVDEQNNRKGMAV